jgi:predicted transcriptional regulator
MFPSSILTAGEYELALKLYRIQDTEKNEVVSRKLMVEIEYYPDLYISYGDIELSRYSPYSGEDITINVTIHNIGDSDARDVEVLISPITRHGSKIPLDGIKQNIEFIGSENSTRLIIPWMAEPPAVNIIKVTIDPENAIGELDEENNEATLNIYIIPPPIHEKNETGPNIFEFTMPQISIIIIAALMSGVAVATLVTTEYSKFMLFKLFLPFYTRVKKEEVLNHEVRELVYDYVQRNPGEHFRAILTKLGLTNGTLIHHLNTLERQNYIKSERDGPFKRFYPTGRQLTEDVLEINGIQMKILDAVNNEPGVTQKDLARLLQTSPPTINYHVKALHMGRLLNIKRDGKNTRCFPGEAINGFFRSGEVS